jgi:hypothetical protein
MAAVTFVAKFTNLSTDISFSWMAILRKMLSCPLIAAAVGEGIKDSNPIYVG